METTRINVHVTKYEIFRTRKISLFFCSFFHHFVREFVFFAHRFTTYPQFNSITIVFSDPKKSFKLNAYLSFVLWTNYIYDVYYLVIYIKVSFPIFGNWISQNKKNEILNVDNSNPKTPKKWTQHNNG
jgi:hypothetical protein